MIKIVLWLIACFITVALLSNVYEKKTGKKINEKILGAIALTMIMAPLIIWINGFFASDYDYSPGTDYGGISFSTLITDANEVARELTGEKMTFSYDEDNWSIIKTGNRFLIFGEVKQSGVAHQITVKIEYNDSFTQYNGLQVKKDGISYA